MLGRNDQGARIVLQKCLRAIAVVHIEIDNGNAGQPAYVQRVFGCNSHIAKDTKPHRALVWGKFFGYAAIRVAMPAALTSSADRPTRARRPLRRLLFDMKTIHVGTALYRTPRARDRHSGAVEQRAQAVHPAYVHHARELDRRYHRLRSPPHTVTPGPVEQILLDHDRTRGASCSAGRLPYGEWSCDVEWLLEEAAHTAACRDWRRMGVVSESVAYGFLVASYRRRMGLVAVREMARHRYRQSQFVGLTRLQLDEIGRERQVQRQRGRSGLRRGRSCQWSSRRRRILPAYELGR